MALVLENLLGHKKVKSQIRELVKSKRLPHALLFTGPEGIGKQKMAQALAQMLACEHQPACGKCGVCLRIEKGTCEVFCVIQPEGQQIKVEQIRQIHEFTRLRLIGKARVILVNEAHRLNIQAANSLLKLLEEPPQDTYFVLVTANLAALPATIRSRCQTMRFEPLPLEDLKSTRTAKDWAYSCSQGRLDLLDKLILPEWEELRSRALQCWTHMEENLRSTDFVFFKTIAKDRTQTQFVVQTWLRLLRDTAAEKSNFKHLSNPDQDAKIKSLSKLDKDQISNLMATVSESLVYAQENVDRLLILENLWMSCHRTVKQHAQVD